MSFVSVTAWHGSTELEMALELTPNFDASTVDHDRLAQMIGKAVVRSINHTRTLGVAPERVNYSVTLHH